VLSELSKAERIVRIAYVERNGRLASIN